MKGDDMRFWDYDENEDYQEEVDGFFEDYDDDDDSWFEMDLSRISRGENEDDFRVLEIATRICEKSFFWKFKSPASKIKILKKVFHNLWETITDKDE